PVPARGGPARGASHARRIRRRLIPWPIRKPPRPGGWTHSTPSCKSCSYLSSLDGQVIVQRHLRAHRVRQLNDKCGFGSVPDEIFHAPLVPSRTVVATAPSVRQSLGDSGNRVQKKPCRDR